MPSELRGLWLRLTPALLALALGEAPQTGRWTSNRLVGGWLVLGFLGGLGFWSLSLIGVYLLPIAVYLSAAYWRRKALLVVLGLVAAAGFVAGAAPWIGYGPARAGHRGR